MLTAGDDQDALTPEERAINRVAWRADILKGTPVYFRALRQHDAPRLAGFLAGTERDDRPVGATDRAWEHARASGLAAAKIFAYPDMLIANPQLLGYYRRLIGASMKAVRNALADPKPFETGRRTTLAPNAADDFAELFNAAISGVLEEAPDFNERDIAALVDATSGSQIQGEIVTRKGQLAQELVWQWILVYLAQHNHLNSLIPRAGALPQLDLADAANVSAAAHRVRTCVARNGVRISYANEPDIEIADGGGRALAVHEIKAGVDLAGAKERYPAASRSFQAARQENPACHTVLVAGCLSAVVKRLIRTQGWVDATYILPQLELDDAQRARYLNREIAPYALR